MKKKKSAGQLKGVNSMLMMLLCIKFAVKDKARGKQLI